MDDQKYHAIMDLLQKIDKRLTVLEQNSIKRIEVVQMFTPDELYKMALALVSKYDFASASLLQRRLSIGYARASRILDQLTENGILGAGDGSKPRKVLRKSSKSN